VSCVPPPCGRTFDGGISGSAISHSPSGTIQLHVPRPITKTNDPVPHRTRSKYPDELRERAIREVRSTGRPVAHFARDLGIHKEALRGWVRQAEVDAGERDDRLTTAERDELKELREENAELRRADEILKAASVFFAQEIDRPRTRPSR
jgi:transposase